MSGFSVTCTDPEDSLLPCFMSSEKQDRAQLKGEVIPGSMQGNNRLSGYNSRGNENKTKLKNKVAEGVGESIVESLINALFNR